MTAYFKQPCEATEARLTLGVKLRFGGTVGLITDRMESGIEQAQVEASPLEKKRTREEGVACAILRHRHPALLIVQSGNSKLKEGTKAHGKKSCVPQIKHTMHFISSLV